MVIDRAVVRADGACAKLFASAFSARRRRVTHSKITVRLPRKPFAFIARQRAAAFRAPASHCASSQGQVAHPKNSAEAELGSAQKEITLLESISAVSAGSDKRDHVVCLESDNVPLRRQRGRRRKDDEFASGRG